MYRNSSDDCIPPQPSRPSATTVAAAVTATTAPLQQWQQERAQDMFVVFFSTFFFLLIIQLDSVCGKRWLRVRMMTPLARKRDVGLLKTDWKMGRTADEKLVGMPGMDLPARPLPVVGMMMEWPAWGHFFYTFYILISTFYTTFSAFVLLYILQYNCHFAF